MKDSLDDIESYYLRKIIQNSYCLKKLPLETIKQIEAMINKFTAVCSIVLKKEVSKYANEHAEKLRREMEERQRLQREKQEAEAQRIRDQIKQQRELMERRTTTRVSYNRYANAKCWKCQGYGHL